MSAGPAEPAGLDLERCAGSFAVCRLDPASPVPDWAAGGELSSVTRTAHELSIVCEATAVPADVTAARDWACLRVRGPLDFEQTGVAASITAPLAAARVPLLMIATHDTDYLLVRERDLDRAAAALADAGHRFD